MFVQDFSSLCLFKVKIYDKCVQRNFGKLACRLKCQNILKNTFDKCVQCPWDSVNSMLGWVKK